MNWLNIPLALLRSPELTGAEPEERATWLFVLGYCADQENGGTIKKCKAWKCRQWQQTCGVTLQEVSRESKLWKWKGEDLLVTFYPIDKEKEVQAKRKAGSAGGKISGKSRRKKAAASQLAYASAEDCKERNEAELQGELQGELKAELQGELERKGKERNGKEGEQEKNLANAFLAELWKQCPAKGRERSSRKKVQTAWVNLSPAPDKEKVKASLDAWKQSDSWAKDGGQFVPALDRWIRDRKFEIEPEPNQTHRDIKKGTEYEETMDMTELQL